MNDFLRTLLAHNLNLSMHLTLEFYYTTYLIKQTSMKIYKLIKWSTPMEPFVTLNTDGSSIGNPGNAGGGEVLKADFLSLVRPML